MLKTIQKEIEFYKNDSIEIFEGYNHSQYRIVRRIGLYQNHIYPTGKIDSQGNYKYWFDIIKPRIDGEIKNIDFDRKHIMLETDNPDEYWERIIAQLNLHNYLDESGEAQKLDEAAEKFSGEGNVVWKETKDGYEILNLNRVYVLNQTAQTLEDSDVIEWDVFSPMDLRKKKDIWDNIGELLETIKSDETNEFYIYERNGEISEKDYYDVLRQKTGEEQPDGDENKFILVKIICGGKEKDKPSHYLYCDEIKKKPYKEAHRGSYTGTWLRKGLYPTLFDIQTRANEIGNQIARGLEYASKTIFRSSDRILAQNILTDLQNGDVIKSQDLSQVQTRMEGLDQLIADWNRLMELANQLSNSYEVVTGESLPSGTPYRLGAVLNQNANKLFSFLRKKLGVAFEDLVGDWILPKALKDLKAKKVLKLTQDSGYLGKYYESLVNSWYIKNLVALPPHGQEEAKAIKAKKLDEIRKSDEELVKLENQKWDNFKARVKVVITNENTNIQEELETLQSFIQLEGDPIRRTALIEMAMKKKNIDVASLPRQQQMPEPQKETPVKKEADQLDELMKQQGKQLRAG